jgi:membrane dipeptidase
MRTAILVLLVSLALVPAALPEDKKPTEAKPVELTDEARRIHTDALLIDGHNDLPWQYRIKADSSFLNLDISRPQKGLHTDIPRLRKGNVGAQFWAAYVPVETRKKGTAVRDTLEQIDVIHRLIKTYPDDFELAQTADDILRIHKKGKVASLLGVEGGHSIDNSLGVLRMYQRLGVRYMTLTHTETLDWADSATDEAKHHGLTPFGEQVVREMNRLGMMVDISHVSAYKALREIGEKYPNEQEREAAMKQWRKDHPIPPCSVRTVVNHIEHIVKTAGIDHVGIGSDFDGIDAVPQQLEDVSCFPYITQELLNRGYTKEQILKILGGNLLRAMRVVEQVANKSKE